MLSTSFSCMQKPFPIGRFEPVHVQNYSETIWRVSFKQLLQYSNLNLALCWQYKLTCFRVNSYTAFLFKYFLSQPVIPKKVQRIPVIQFLDLKVYESTYGLSLTIKWNCNCISNITSCNFILLYFKHLVGFENGTLIGWIWKCWNQLFQFCYLIGFHCLGGHSFSKYAVRQECSYSKDVFSVLDWIYEMTPGGVLPENLGRGVGPASQNPYPIYDQNLWFFPTLFMTWPKTWYPIYDLTLLVAGFI